MTALKNKILPALTLVLGLGLMNGSFAQRVAEAGPTESIPAIKITNTRPFLGRYIHVLYAIARPGALNVTKVPYIDYARLARTVQVTGDEVNFEPVIGLEKIKFRGAYNMIIFVWSYDPVISWANQDQNPNVNYVWFKTLNKFTIDQHVNQNGPDATFVFSL